MSKICKVTINDEPFLANRGELLLEGLAGRHPLAVPHHGAVEVDEEGCADVCGARE